MKQAFKIKEVKPGIFIFEFKEQYDMCMHFLRYQEFYESDSPKFRGKSFEIIDYMRWYSFKQPRVSAGYEKAIFTYPADWSGFNFPGNIIEQVWELGITDKNIYDYEMKEAWKQIKKQGWNNFYIIGVVKDSDSLDHELAHAHYYLAPRYKKEMKKLVYELDPVIKTSCDVTLTKLGYHKKVHVDEIQAYMATGLSSHFGSIAQLHHKPFEDFFVKFNNIIGPP